MKNYQSINPYTGEFLKDFDCRSSDEIEVILSKGLTVFSEWRKTSFEQRKMVILSLAALLEKQEKRLSHLIVTEMGKPITEARAEIKKCASLCLYYAEHSEEFLISRKHDNVNYKAEVVFQPIGIILTIMPWNFPFWQVFRVLIPIIMVGNVGLLKHAPNVPQCALAIEKLILEAGFPVGGFQNLFLTNTAIAKIIADNRIKGVTLTGSDKAGSIIAMEAGKNIKKVVLELGGNDPFIVLEDANIEQAVDKLIDSRFMNAGQTCIAAKRLILSESIKDIFLTELKKKIPLKIRQGNPLDEKTTITILARKDLKESLATQVDILLDKGGHVLFKMKCVEHENAFPIMLIDVSAVSSKDRDIELFGPVLQILNFRNEEELVEIANDTSYGLGASIWSENIRKANSLALDLDVGGVYINEMEFSDPSLPFGGTKKSGIGRELAIEGLKEFVNVKTIFVQQG